MRVLVSTSSFADFDPKPLDLLKQMGYEVVLNPFKRTLTKNEAVTLYSDGIDGVIAGTEPVDKDVLSNAKRLRVISRCGVGTDNVDMGFAAGKGIKVYNTADAPTDAVAELTVGLILSLLRGIPSADRQVRGGVWEKRMGNLLLGKKVGILGMGRIGKRTAMLLSSMGAEIIFYDPLVNENFNNFTRSGLEDLLRESDIISLHMSYSGDKKGFIGEKQFSSMKKTALLVNVSRGGIVDEPALYAALKTGKIRGAAMDVFEKEPYTGPLMELDNVILTPHIGSYAKEGRIKMEMDASENLIKGLAGGVSR